MNFSNNYFTSLPCNEVPAGTIFYYKWNFYRMQRILKDRIKALNLSSGQVEKLHRWEYNQTKESRRRNYGIYSGYVQYDKTNLIIKTVPAEILIQALREDSEFQEKLKNFGLNINNILTNLGEQP
jgi:hypothetical protein